MKDYILSTNEGLIVVKASSSSEAFDVANEDFKGRWIDPFQKPIEL